MFAVGVEVDDLLTRVFAVGFVCVSVCLCMCAREKEREREKERGCYISRCARFVPCIVLYFQF